MRSGVSVIICCYNSAPRLLDTLRYLANQITPVLLSWEVVVINNNSTDKTAEFAVQEWQKYDVGVPLRVIDEPTPGLSAAREKGIEASLYDCLIFCDDDNWLAPDYVSTAYELLRSHPQVAAIGGNNIGAYEVTPPDWVKYFLRSYAIGEQGTGLFQILGLDQYVFGAGMAIRKQAYQEIKNKGFSFYLTDRIGSKVIGGGDVELCFIFKLAGYQVAYSSALTLQHYMPATRIEKSYLIKMWRQYNYSWLVFEAYKVLLKGDDNKKLLTEKYWKRLAYGRLTNRLPYLPKCLYYHFKNKVIYFLPYEAHMLYDYFLLRNTSTLVNIIRELKIKVEDSSLI